MPDPTSIFTFIAALGCGLVAGVLFAFSSFVMAALSRLPPAQDMAAMQAINITVINVSFMASLFGTAAICVGLAIAAGMQWQRPGSACLLAGCLLYVIGTIAVTAVFHVPRNDALAVLDPAAPESAQAWATYLRVWTAGNHVRTLAALAASGLLIASLVLRRSAEA